MKIFLQKSLPNITKIFTIESNSQTDFPSEFSFNSFELSNSKAVSPIRTFLGPKIRIWIRHFPDVDLDPLDMMVEINFW